MKHATINPRLQADWERWIELKKQDERAALHARCVELEAENTRLRDALMYIADSLEAMDIELEVAA